MGGWIVSLAKLKPWENRYKTAETEGRREGGQLKPLESFTEEAADVAGVGEERSLKSQSQASV